jgi:WD40 repeat protein
MAELEERLVGPEIIQEFNDSKTDILIEKFISWEPSSHVLFKGHTSEVWSCTISSDNNSIFSGSSDGMIIAWNAEGINQYMLKGHSNIVGVLILTKDQKMLISADWDSNIFMWELENMQLVKNVKGNSTKIYAGSLSLSGKILGTCGDGPVFDLWNALDLSLIGSVNINSTFSLSILFDGSASFAIVSCEGGFVKFCNTKNLAVEKIYQPDQESRDDINSMALAQEDRLLILGYKKKNLIKILNVKDFSLFHTFDNFKKSVRGVIVTSDSKYLIAYSADQSIKIFDIPGKSLEWIIDGCEGFIFSGCLSKDNTVLVCGSSDWLLRKWTIGSKKRVRPIQIHQKAIYSMAISPDGCFMATGGEESTIKLVNLKNIHDYSDLKGHESKIWDLKFSPNGKFLASGSEDKTVRLWNYQEKTLEFVFTEHKFAIFCLAFSPDSTILITGCQETFITMYETTGNFIRSWKAHTDSIFAVEVSNDGNYIVSGSSDYSIKIWDLHSGVLIHKIRSDYNEIDSIAFSPNCSSIALGYRNGMIRLFKWPTDPQNFILHKITTFKKHTDRVRDVSFSADSAFLVSCSFDKTIRVWNVDDHMEEYSIHWKTSEIRRVKFDSGNTQIISADKSGKVYFWDISKSDAMELADIRNPIENYLYLSTIKKKDNINSKHIHYKFGNARINLAHFYSFLGKDKLLISALRAGTEIKRDADGNSPLFYALSKKSQNCVDKILKYFHEVKVRDLDLFLMYSYQIRDDFELLIKNYSQRLPEFLDDVFYSVPNPNNFGFPKVNLPIVNYSDIKKFDYSLFIGEKPADRNLRNEVNFQLLTLPFTIPCELGSTSSLRFLENINSCSNPKIMQTHLIQTYIRHKWDAVWYIILSQVLVLAMLEVVMILLLIDYHFPSNSVHDPNYWLQSFFIFLNLLHGLYELIQAFALGSAYFSFWNYIDIIRLLLSLLWSSFCFFWPLSEFHILTVLMVIFNLVKGLTCFRVINKARHYVRLVKSAIEDSFYFLLIFFYTTFSFGVLYFISNDTEKDVFSIWTAAYELNMGEISRANSENVWTYVYFFLASVINVIIMLNLLISILGDTFDSFQLNADQMDYFEMAELVYETESLMFWKRGENNKRFIQVCEEVLGQEDQKWGGKVRQVLDVIKKMRMDNQSQSIEMNQKIDLIYEKINEIKLKS